MNRIVEPVKRDINFVYVHITLNLANETKELI